MRPSRRDELRRGGGGSGPWGRYIGVLCERSRGGPGAHRGFSRCGRCRIALLFIGAGLKSISAVISQPKGVGPGAVRLRRLQASCHSTLQRGDRV